jgi:hypothetical protein
VYYFLGIAVIKNVEIERKIEDVPTKCWKMTNDFLRKGIDLTFAEPHSNQSVDFNWDACSFTSK